MYRAAIKNGTNKVLAIGISSHYQPNEDYRGIAKWSPFTFNDYPLQSGQDWHHEVDGESLIVVPNE